MNLIFTEFHSLLDFALELFNLYFVCFDCIDLLYLISVLVTFLPKNVFHKVTGHSRVKKTT